MPQREPSYLAKVRYQLGEIDRAVYTAVAVTPAPDLDGPLRRLSRAADNSLIWLGVAAAIAGSGGPAGRRAAVRGLLAVGATSAVVNLGVKSLWTRRRPDRTDASAPRPRYVAMPRSGSFPSGHSASGFAFAASVGRDLPWLALPLRLVAAAVAYSRVHTGVHYPGDAVIGSIVGASVAQLTALPLPGDTSRPAQPQHGLRRHCGHGAKADQTNSRLHRAATGQARYQCGSR